MEHINCIDFDTQSQLFLKNTQNKIVLYEQMALDLFEKSTSCKSSNDAKLQYTKYLEDKDIWAMSTKCVTYPKPLNLYVIGNGNGNANLIISDMMDANKHKKHDSYNTQLLYSIIKKNKKLIKSLFKHGNVNIDYQDEETGFTALHLAIINRAPADCIKFLLDKHASITICEKTLSRTPIHLAISTMNYDIISTILTNATPDDLNILDKNGVTPLAIYYRFSNNESTSIEQLLIEKGAKYSLLKPFFNELSKNDKLNLSDLKNKVFEFIMMEMEKYKNENIELKNINDENKQVILNLKDDIYEKNNMIKMYLTQLNNYNHVVRTPLKYKLYYK